MRVNSSLKFDRFLHFKELIVCSKKRETVLFKKGVPKREQNGSCFHLQGHLHSYKSRKDMVRGVGASPTQLERFDSCF